MALGWLFVGLDNQLKPMFISNTKIAWRNLNKNKVYSFINIVGLATGMAVAMIISLWIYDELSANRHFTNYHSVYQVMMHQTFDGRRGSQQSLPYPMGEELKAKFPDLQAVVMSDYGGKHSLLVGDKKVSKNGHFIGSEAVDMFSLQVVQGARDPLQDPYSIVLTEETADALFGKENPIGQLIKFDNKTSLKVTAVVKQQPKNSWLSFDFLVPFSLEEKLNTYIEKYHKNNWGNNSWQVFVQLKPGSSEKAFNASVKDLVLSHLNDENVLHNVKPEVFIHPMSKWRLYSDFKDGKNVGGFIKYVRMFGILGLIVLIIACINFMNLSTARSEKRAKEVGVRKAIGSSRKELIYQFLGESMLMAFISLLLALLLVAMALPFFNTLTDKQMNLQIETPWFWVLLLVFTLLTGLLAGSYPAFYLSSFNPVRVLKGNLKAGNGAVLPRKILVVMQFACSVILMIGTVVVYRQIQFGKNQPIGFNNHGLITVEATEDLLKSYTVFEQEALQSGAITSICKSNSPPSQIYSDNNGWEWPGAKPVDKTVSFSTITSEYDYTKTLGIKLLQGRDFSRSFADSNAVILNQAAVKRMGLKNPLGETLKWNGQQLTIVGVIPDIQMESPFRPISPLTLIFRPDWVGYINLRLNPNMPVSKSMALLKPIFEKFNPAFPFEYQFADEEYAKKFNYEELVGNLAAIVAVLAIFISCLGLFGLASFTAEQRVKEIGVRKVLGAGIFHVWQLLSKEFLWLTLISCLIAIPIAYFSMKEWLNNYENKINIGIGVFLLVIATALLTTVLTVSFQAIKAALANPVKSLRTE